MRRADVEVTLDLVVGGGDSPKLGLLKVTVDRVLYVFGVPRMQQFYLLSSLHLYMYKKNSSELNMHHDITLHIHVQYCISYHD